MAPFFQLSNRRLNLAVDQRPRMKRSKLSNRRLNLAVDQRPRTKRSKLGVSKMRREFKQLKRKMADIIREQSEIKEGRGTHWEKFEAIESECHQLREETHEILRQSATTRLRLTTQFRFLLDFSLACFKTTVRAFHEELNAVQQDQRSSVGSNDLQLHHQGSAC